MKKLLSVILAITTVLSTVAFALPSAVTVADTVEETVAGGDEVADLAAAVTLARGKNMATGTADAFDGDTYTDLSWLTKGASDTTLEVIDDPTGVKDKVLAMTFPAGTSTGYPNFTLDFGGDLDTDIGHTYVYIAFDYQKYVSDVSGYISNKSFWMLNTYSSSGDFAPISFDIDANDGWIHYGKLLDYSVNQSGYDIDSSDNTYYNNHDINKTMIIQFGVNTGNTVPVQILLDNFMVVPAYKITYNDADGNAVGEEYVAVDEEGKVLTSFTPETVLKDGIVYSGWSLTQGGSAIDSVELGTEDIVLYATKTVDAFTGATITLDNKLTEIGATATATVNLNGNPEYDTTQATWAVADTSIATVSYDKDSGVATVKAIGAGTTDITFTYGDSSVTDTITVATGPVVAASVTSGSAISEFTDCDLDVYDYITFNVTNTSGADATIEVSLNGSDTGSDIGVNLASYTITVPAGAQNMDVYLDATEEIGWAGSGNSVVATAGSGVTINNAKLWAVLRTEDGVELVSDINLLSEAGASIVVTAQSTCDLEGVYGSEYSIAVNVTNNCASAEVNGNSVTVTGTSGSGSVMITATSKTDSSITATKEILVNIIEGRGIGYKWDFNDATNPGFTVSQRYTGTEFTGTTADVRAVYATLPGGESAVPVELSTGTVDGKSVTIVKQTTYGSMSSLAQDGVFKVTEYPYLVFKAKSNSNEVGHKLGIYMMYSDHTWGEDATKLTPDVTLTTDWKLYAIDASESAAFAEEDSGISGQTFKQMQFSTGQYSTISNEILTGSDGSTYYIEGDVTYSPDNNIEIDEMYFANYDPTKILYAVSLKADKTSVDGDGVITLTPEVFGSDVVVNDDVNYTVGDTAMASVFKNSDGTATVTPLKDGTVTITATSVMDETASASVELTFTNIPTRTVAYDLKLMLIGNSYLEHAYLATADKDLYNGFMNANDIPRGMAATSPELDYYSRLCYYLQNGFNATFTSKRQGGAVIEQAWKQGLASGTPTDLTGWDKDVSEAAMKNAAVSIIDYMQREQPNLITIQLSENAAHAYDVSAEWFYEVLFKMIDDNRPENSVVVIISPMGTNAASRTQQVVGAKYGFHWADNTWIGDDYGWGEDNQYLAYWQYPDYTNSDVVEFRSHPGDFGMEEIAKSAYALFEQYIPTTIPANFVTVPDSISISGNETITNAGGTSQLTVNVSPASSTPDVYWSVDNEYIASVDEKGLVTALLNGTVTVTAVSAYDESVVATKTITITGQTQHYTLTYDAGTADTVSNIPEAFEYAAGTYTIPELVALPDRNGYKFLGWSESEGGAVVESVEMTSAKTVYAVWQFADSWTFEKDGDLEGILVGGFNTAVTGGVMTTISYDGIAVGVSDKTLLIPSALYKTFKINVSMSTVNDGDYFTLTITNDAGTETTYTMDTLVGMNEYTFDISDVTGTITGFSLVTSNDADGVGMTVDSMEFVKSEIEEDTVYDSFEVVADTTLDANGNLVTLKNVSVAENTTLTFAPGSYVVGNITGAGEIKASVNANVIVTGETKPEGYVEIDIGTKTGVRYAEVKGSQYRIAEADDNTKYGIIVGEENLLVEIVDVADISDASATVTRYFLVKAADGTYEELPMGNYMSNYGNRDLRIPDEQVPSKGIRFKAQVTTASKNATEYNITEYGYIIALEEVINNNGGQLNFDLTRADGNTAYATGKAYIKGDIDKVFDSSTDGIHIFTSVLYGCAPENYGKRLVVKTYTNVTINGEEYVVYGEPMVESFYSMAKELEGTEGLSDEANTIIAEIIAAGEDFSNESGLPGDDLWE